MRPLDYFTADKRVDASKFYILREEFVLNSITFRIFETIIKKVSHSPLLIRRVHHGVLCEEHAQK